MNNAFWARVLIAILFVYAGVGKLMGFENYATGNMMTSVFGSFTTIALVVAIFVEIVVALAFAFGYKAKWSALVLGGFTALVTIIYHNPWATGAFDGMMMGVALKNVAIIGGIWLALQASSHHQTHHAH